MINVKDVAGNTTTKPYLPTCDLSETYIEAPTAAGLVFSLNWRELVSGSAALSKEMANGYYDLPYHYENSPDGKFIRGGQLMLEGLMFRVEIQVKFVSYGWEIFVMVHRLKHNTNLH